MNEVYKVLRESDLLKGFSDFESSILMSNLRYYEKKYTKDAEVATQDTPCESIGIVLYGTFGVRKFYPSGKTLNIATLETGDMFGEVIVFSDQHLYPASITALSDAKLMWISKENLLTAFESNNKLTANFLSILSEKILLLNKKINLLSLDSLKQKIAKFLLEKSSEFDSIEFDIGISRDEMANILDIQRPSLSRELSNMKKEGLIDFTKSKFNLLAINKLEELLY